MVKKYITLLIVFTFAILLSNCGGGGKAYDPVLKYEKAGHTAHRFMPTTSEQYHGIYGWQISNMLIIQKPVYTDYKTIYDIYANTIIYDNVNCGYKAATVSEDTNYILSVKLTDSQSVIASYSLITKEYKTINTFDYVTYGNCINILPDENCVFVSSMDKSTYINVTDTNGNIVVGFSNLSILPEVVFAYDTKNIFARDTDGNIMEFDILSQQSTKHEITYLQGVEYYIESVSPKGKYLIIRKEIIYQGEMKDSGLSIINLSNKTVTDLFSMENLNFDVRDVFDTTGPTADYFNVRIYDSYGFISPDLKRMAFAVHSIGGFDETISTRHPDDLPGLWYLDISKLNLSE